MRNHTCSTAQYGPCKPCDAMAAEWLATPEQINELPGASKQDLYSARGDRRVSLGALDADFTPELADWQADPQRAYDTDPDFLRAAVRVARKSDPATADVLANIARAMHGARTPAVVGALPTEDGGKDTLRPNMVRADAKRSAAAIRAAMVTTRAEAGEALRPDFATGAIGWKVTPARDFRTMAGPVVTSVRAFVVGTDGTTERATVPVRVTRDRVAMSGKGETRERAEWTEILDRTPALGAAERWLTIRAARTDGTTWTPDASTYAADRFTEALEPVGPVRKASGSKRKKDGRIGGPAVVTTTPGRGAR